MSVDAANPFALGGGIDALANPFAFGQPAYGPGGLGGLGIDALDGWHGYGDLTAKFGASAGDQSTGGVISFGRTNTVEAASNRALGLLATSSTGPTAFGVRFVNATGRALNQVSVRYTAELWRQSSVAKSLQVSYAIQPNPNDPFPNSFTDALPGLEVRFPTDPADSKPMPVDGTAPSNQAKVLVKNRRIVEWPPGAALWLVWQMADAAGKGQGLAIDNFSFAASRAKASLGVELRGTEALLRWPSEDAGYILETSDSLGPNAIWTPVSYSIDPLAAENSVSISVTDGGPHFFRLRQSQ